MLERFTSAIDLSKTFVFKLRMATRTGQSYGAHERLSLPVWGVGAPELSARDRNMSHWLPGLLA